VQFDAAGHEIVTTLPNNGHANAINDFGEVAGYDSSAQAIIWEVDSRGNVLATDNLPPLRGYASSNAICIEANGHAAGHSSYTKKKVYTHATLWPSPTSSPTDLGVLQSGGTSVAFGINTVNNTVQVVGTASVPSGGAAFLWKNGVMTNLNKLISAQSVSLQAAYAINSHGQIVATAAVTVGNKVETHAVLLTPK
jgi:probable HAF family extracellular repeat protein